MQVLNNKKLSGYVQLLGYIGLKYSKHQGNHYPSHSLTGMP